MHSTYAPAALWRWSINEMDLCRPVDELLAYTLPFALNSFPYIGFSSMEGHVFYSAMWPVLSFAVTAAVPCTFQSQSCLINTAFRIAVYITEDIDLQIPGTYTLETRWSSHKIRWSRRKIHRRNRLWRYLFAFIYFESFLINGALSCWSDTQCRWWMNEWMKGYGELLDW